MQPISSGTGEIVIAVQTSVLYHGNGMIEVVHPAEELRGDVELGPRSPIEIQIEKRPQPVDRRVPQRRIERDENGHRNRHAHGQCTHGRRSRYRTVQARKGRGASQPVNLAESVSPSARPKPPIQRQSRQAGANRAQANSQQAVSGPSSVAKCACAKTRGIVSSAATAITLTAHTPYSRCEPIEHRPHGQGRTAGSAPVGLASADRASRAPVRKPIATRMPDSGGCPSRTVV